MKVRIDNSESGRAGLKMSKDAELKAKIKALPSSPGVYIFRNDGNEILYIGKAKDLKKRVSSYFRPSRSSYPQSDTKIAALVGLIADIEVLLTKNEVEALMLELNLIKRHKPRFNTDLKDGKSYPYVAISKESVKRIYITRELDQLKNSYYGPFTNAKTLRETYHELRRNFPFRDCASRKFELHRQKRTPCLDYHIGLCSAPCAAKISDKDYASLVAEVEAFYSGDPATLLDVYKTDMIAASDAQLFEQAALWRDRIKLIKKILSRQTVIFSKPLNADVIAAAPAGSIWIITLLKVRSGRLEDSENFELARGITEPISSFMQRYYYIGTNIPSEIIVKEPPDELELTQEYLNRLSGRKVKLIMPSRGDKLALVKIASESAAQNARTKLATGYLRTEQTIKELVLMQELLGIDRSPQRIECYDISHLGGTQAVGSMSVLKMLSPAKGSYRRFRIRSKNSQDDLSMLYEVLRRRLKHLSTDERNEDDLGNWPDLIVIDGGAAQLAAAVKAITDSNLGRRIDIISIAKKREEIFLPGFLKPICAPPDSRSLQAIQLARDEAHRFAHSYHVKLRDREMRHSLMDNVPGIGKQRKLLLLRKFGSLKKIVAAEPEELASILPTNVARTLYLYLHSDLNERVS